MVMKEWQELGQSVFIGVIFSFLVAKLLSLISQFKHDNLRLVRQQNLSPNESSSIDDDDDDDDDEKKSLLEDDDDDDEWEPLLKDNELNEQFTAACAFIASLVASASSSSSSSSDGGVLSNELQLKLYGLYKIATEGPCGNTPQPSALQFSKRAKWDAWQRLGAMSPEEAMQNYIAIVTELNPSWEAESNSKNQDGDDGGTSSAAKRTMGPVFSSFVLEDSDNEVELQAIHAFSREGEVDDMLKCIDSDISVDLKDSEGRTPLHWGVDRGHLNVVELLVSNKADVNATDNEGQTPLHYAAMCEREAIAEMLVSHGANTALKDKDGLSPCDFVCKLKWPWMQQQQQHSSYLG